MNSPEKEVVEKVRTYFKQICQIEGEPRQMALFEPPPAYKIKDEYVVPIGTYRCRADLALFDPDGNVVVIVECKSDRRSARRKNVSGREQLKSYLCATDTVMGVFASSQNIEDWEFYRNLGRNTFKEISRSDFEKFISFSTDIEKNRRMRFMERFAARIEKEKARAEESFNQHKAEIDRDVQRRIAEYERQQQQKLRTLQDEQTGCFSVVAIFIISTIIVVLSTV